MKAYKGFSKTMKCRRLQLKEGELYEKERAELCKLCKPCKELFLAYENPIDVFIHYAPGESIFREVELENVSEMREKGSEICGKKIKIGAEISLHDMIRAGVNMDIELAAKDAKNAVTAGVLSPAVTAADLSPAVTTGDLSPAATAGAYSPAVTAKSYSHAATAGLCSHALIAEEGSHAATAGNCSPAAAAASSSTAVTAGDGSPAITVGKYSPAVTAGEHSNAVTAGDHSPAVTAGKRSNAVTAGKNSIAVAIGRNSKAKSTIGNWIVLAEYGKPDGISYPVLCVKCGKIDGKMLKPDVWYSLKNGEFVEVE